MIEVHLLRYALAAADTGSFSQAAERFRVKQSTLSKRIGYLEQRIGMSIFHRSTRGVSATESGLQFLARARAIVADLEHLSLEAKGLASGGCGRLRLGFHASLAGGDLRAILDTYRSAFPQIELTAVESSRESLLHALDRERLDVAIVAGEGATDGRCALTLWSEALMVSMPAGHRLADVEPLYWTDLRGMSFLVTQADPGRLIAAMIAARMTGPDNRPEITAQAVCRDNLPGLACAKRVAVTAGPIAPIGTTQFREVHDTFGATRLDQSIQWRRTNRNPALADFLTLIGKRYCRRVTP